MLLPNPLYKGTIIKRYKRFLADIQLETGEEITAHVANTGPMTSCWGPNWPVIVSKSDNPNRKLPYTLELTHNGESWIGVNTQAPNRLVEEGLKKGLISEFAQYDHIQREAKVFNSKIDFLLSRGEGPSPREESCYVEVKSVTLRGEGTMALFPDTRSERAHKHVLELIKLKKEGFRTAMLFIAQREDIDTFSPAKKIHPEYAFALKNAHEQGVEIYCYRCSLNENKICLSKKIPITL